MNWGSLLFTQGEPVDKHNKTSQWAPLELQYETVNVYFQQSSQWKTNTTRYKGDYCA